MQSKKRTAQQRRRGGVLLTMKFRVTTRVPERCQASPGACRGRICYSSLPLTCCLVERHAPGGGRSPLRSSVCCGGEDFNNIMIRPAYALKFFILSFSACALPLLSLRRDSELPPASASSVSDCFRRRCGTRELSFGELEA